jgi:hypothetical protein
MNHTGIMILWKTMISGGVKSRKKSPLPPFAKGGWGGFNGLPNRQCEVF